MEHLGPVELAYIIGAAVCVLTIRLLWDDRDRWLPWALACWDRFVAVRLPASPADLAPRTMAAPPAPRTDGAPRAHAENAGAPGARTAPAPPIGGALTPDLRTAIAQIAGHKVQQPGDGKSATARALGIARSGTSERYATFSAAWDLLYPPPTDPAPAEYVTDRDRRLLRELVEDI